MRYRLIALMGICSFCFFLFGCNNFDFFQSKKPQAPKAVDTAYMVKGTVVAKVNNMPITLEDMIVEIDAYNKSVPSDRPEDRITAREGKLQYLKEEMITRAYLYQEGLNRGLDRDDDIRRALDKTKEDLVVVALLRQEKDKIEKEITSKDVEEYYNTWKEQLKEPEERQAREIVVSNEQDAREILIQLLQGSDFATIARDRSRAPSAKDGGDLGYIKRGEKAQQLDAVAFSDSLDVGKISSIFKVPGGFCIIKIEGKRGGKQKSLADLYDDIRRALIYLKQKEKVKVIVENVSKSAKLELYEGEIK